MVALLRSEPPADPEAERRHHSRIELAVPAEVASQGALVPAALCSASLGGAAIRAELDCGVGERVTVRFRAPRHGWVSIEGEIVRKEPGALFVRFLALRPDAFAALLSLRDHAEARDDAGSESRPSE
jgi:hypothetical protein